MSFHEIRNLRSRAWLQITSDFRARASQRFFSTTHAHRMCVRSICVIICDNGQIDRASLCVSGGGKSLWCPDSKMLHCNSRSGCVPIFTASTENLYSIIRYVHYRFSVLAVSIRMSDKNSEMALLLKFNKYIQTKYIYRVCF